MNELPSGWQEVPLGELVVVLDAQRVPVSADERALRPGSVPYYGATGQVGTIDVPIFDEELLLLGEDGVQFFDPGKPKAYLINGPAWVNNHAHVLRPHTDKISREYLCHFLNYCDYRGFANGTTRLKLTQAAMKSLPIALPHVDEQRRIVEILDNHFARLASAEAALESAKRRHALLEKKFLWSLFKSLDDAEVRLDTVAEVRLGRQRSPSNHHGDQMRQYLRAANITWQGLDLTDVKEMHFTDAEMESYRLLPGDVLVNEASGSPAEVGKSCIFNGEIADCAIQNTLLRVRCHSAEPHFIHNYLRSVARSGGFLADARGVGINHLGRAKLAELRVRLPSKAKQLHIVARIAEFDTQTEHARSALESIRAKEARVRRSLLQAAFTGQLTKEFRDE